MDLKVPLIIFLLFQTIDSSISRGKYSKNLVFNQKEKLQRSLVKLKPKISKESPENVIKTVENQDGAPEVTGNDEISKEKNIVKKQLSIMEPGTLDEFLMSTTHRSVLKNLQIPQKEEGYFVFPPIIDFGDKGEEPEVPQNQPNWPFYAPSFEVNKRTSLPPKIASGNDPQSTPKPSETVPNLGYQPLRPFYASNFPHKPNNPAISLLEAQLTSTKLPEVTTKAPNFNYVPSRPFYAPNFMYPGTTPPKNETTPLEDRFGETSVTTGSGAQKPETTSKVPDLSYKPTKPFYLPNMTYPGTTRPPKPKPEDEVVDGTIGSVPQKPETTSKVPDLNYKPTKPFYWSNMTYPGTARPPKPKPEDEISEVTTGNVPQKPESTSKVPDLSYKPTKPFYLSNMTYPGTTGSSNTKPEDEIAEVTTGSVPQKPESTSKVPDLSYKPTKPFYWSNMTYPVTVKPPKPKPEDAVVEVTTGSGAQKPETTSKVPDLSYKPSKPFYWSNMTYPGTIKPPKPKPEDELVEVTTRSGAQKPETTSKTPYPVTKWPQSNQNGDFEDFWGIYTTKSSTAKPQTTYKVPSLGYKPMRPFYAQGWNGYPRPTTKNPNFLAKGIQNGETKIKKVETKIVDNIIKQNKTNEKSKTDEER